MIPCLNEEATLAQVVGPIPANIAGIDRIETLIIDDGSTDNTIAVANQLGVNHIVKLKQHLGLARAFQAGLDACLELGADIVVNTDGDNQYPSAQIPQLVGPILAGHADMVVGNRQTETVAEFSFTKRLLQRFGSWTVRKLSGATEVIDAVSGFRAYSRYSAARVCINNSYSYTIESLIHASKRGMRIVSVPITTNPTTRPSRLMRNIRSFVMKSATISVKSYLMHEPLKSFAMMGVLSCTVGAGLGILLTYLEITDTVNNHMPIAVLSLTFLATGLFLPITGLLSDHVAANRKLLEELVWRQKLGSPPAPVSSFRVTSEGQVPGLQSIGVLAGPSRDQNEPEIRPIPADRASQITIGRSELN
jgi:hypothetical protein